VPKHQRSQFWERSTTELLVLMVAFTICSAVVAGGTSIIVSELIHPENDTSRAVVFVNDVINTLIGLLAGFLAGRSEVAVTSMSSPYAIVKPETKKATNATDTAQLARRRAVPGPDGGKQQGPGAQGQG
jgi:hypothetical protein